MQPGPTRSRSVDVPADVLLVGKRDGIDDELAANGLSVKWGRGGQSRRRRYSVLQVELLVLSSKQRGSFFAVAGYV